MRLRTHWKQEDHCFDMPLQIMLLAHIEQEKIVPQLVKMLFLLKEKEAKTRVKKSRQLRRKR